MSTWNMTTPQRVTRRLIQLADISPPKTRRLTGPRSLRHHCAVPKPLSSGCEGSSSFLAWIVFLAVTHRPKCISSFCRVGDKFGMGKGQRGLGGWEGR